MLKQKAFLPLIRLTSPNLVRGSLTHSTIYQSIFNKLITYCINKLINFQKVKLLSESLAIFTLLSLKHSYTTSFIYALFFG